MLGAKRGWETLGKPWLSAAELVQTKHVFLLFKLGIHEDFVHYDFTMKDTMWGPQDS
jgi:hypothetical protein